MTGAEEWLSSGTPPQRPPVGRWVILCGCAIAGTILGAAAGIVVAVSELLARIR